MSRDATSLPAGTPELAQRTRGRPAYGTLKYTLVSSPDGKPPLTIEQRIFTDDGTTSFYDEEALDFVTWKGSWKTVQRMGPFGSQEDARLFMVRRLEGGPDAG